MAELSGADFDEFHAQVWGRPAFPWQTRLATQVIEEGRWPSVIDLPTGSGKTSALDIGLFALAACPGVFPRRVVFVIDRRLVVDQTAARAEHLAQALDTAREGTGVLDNVADRLRALSSTGSALSVGRLRGGGPIGGEWAKWPDQPAVMVSTIDQVGSRLLFRGYGVSQRMWPVHAGLVGNDCLILLDEVHLSRPFAETLMALESGGRVAQELPRRWHVVQMSATPIGTIARPFRLDPSIDLDDPDSELAVRVQAPKSARLHPIDERRKPIDAVFAAQAPHLIGQISDQGTVIGCVVNRVATARAVAAALRKSGVDVALVTGRMRPHDRADTVRTITCRANPDREPSSGTSLVVVATQCIEVGVDISFDAMVTEVAPLSSLRQRFGRLDRRGRQASAGQTAQALVVGVESSLRPDQRDPVYDDAMRHTWEALTEAFGERAFDVGPMSPDLERLDHEHLEPGAVHAPVMLPGHLDNLVQTNPVPAVGPIVADFLHGVVEMDPDVSLVWRWDVTCSEATLDAARTALGVLPPMAGEAMAVPLRAVRRWLHGDDEVPVSDVDSRAAEEQDATGGRRVLRWRGRDDIDVIEPADIAPGDVLVVPSSYGGLSEGTWDPSSTDAASDIGDVVSLDDGRAVVRILLSELFDGEPDDEAVADGLRDRVASRLRSQFLSKPAAAHVWEASRGRLRTVLYDTGHLGRAVVVAAASEELPVEFMDGSDEANSFTGVFVSLASHNAGVGAQAKSFAERCGLSDKLVSDLELAGRIHDLGKADPRFQARLFGNEVEAAIADEPIAKSRHGAAHGDRRHGYPRGMRHEYLSVELATSDEEILANATDRDLVLHLVGTHHGNARPWPVLVSDPAPREVSVVHDGRTLTGRSDLPSGEIGVEAAERFWRLTRRYGWHGLAWLEAILRLADHRRSEEESHGR